MLLLEILDIEKVAMMNGHYGIQMIPVYIHAVWRKSTIGEDSVKL